MPLLSVKISNHNFHCLAGSSEANQLPKFMTLGGRITWLTSRWRY